MELYEVLEQYGEDKYNTMINENVEIQTLSEGILSSLLSKFKKKDNKKNDNMIGKEGYLESKTKINFTTIYVHNDSLSSYTKSHVIESVTSEFGCWENNNLIIYKKNIEKIKNSGLNLYKFKIISKAEENHTYNIQIIDKIEYKSIEEALKDNNISYNIKDTSSIEKERKRIYNALISIVKQAFSKAKAQGLRTSPGWNIGKPDDTEFYDDFINGLDNEIEICDGNAWDYCGNARDEEKFMEYAEVYQFLYDAILSGIKANSLLKNGTLEDQGDWDGTDFVYILKK